MKDWLGSDSPSETHVNIRPHIHSITHLTTAGVPAPGYNSSYCWWIIQVKEISTLREFLVCGKRDLEMTCPVCLFPTPWTVAYQAAPSMGFSRQEYWSGLPLPSPLGSTVFLKKLGIKLLLLLFVVHLLSCLTLQPMDCSMPVFLVLHYLLEFAQTHVHWVGDAIQPSCLLSSPSYPAFSVSQN